MVDPCECLNYFRVSLAQALAHRRNWCPGIMEGDWKQSVVSSHAMVARDDIAHGVWSSVAYALWTPDVGICYCDDEYRMVWFRICFEDIGLGRFLLTLAF